MDSYFNYTNTTTIITTIDDDNGFTILSIILLIMISIALFLLVIATGYIIIVEIRDCIVKKSRVIEINHYIYNSSKNFNPLYNQPDKSTDQLCTICLDSSDKNLISLNCGHNFHKSCIDKWFYKCNIENHKLECPMCRGVFDNV